MDVEDEDSGFGDGALLGGRADGGEHLGLGDEELALRGFHVMVELVGCVGGICAGEDAAAGDDAEEEHGVVDLGG